MGAAAADSLSDMKLTGKYTQSSALIIEMPINGKDLRKWKIQMPKVRPNDLFDEDDDVVIQRDRKLEKTRKLKDLNKDRREKIRK